MLGGGAQTKRQPWIRGSPRPFLPRGSYRKRASFPPMLGTRAAGPGSVPTLPLAGELTTPRRAGLPALVSPRLDLLDKPLCERPAGGRQAVGGPWAGSLVPPPRGPQPGGPLPSNVRALPMARTVSALQNCGLAGVTLSLTLRWFAGSLTRSTSLPEI